MIKGKESYELIKSSCEKVFCQVNELVKSGKLNIDGKGVPVSIYLGGDYKVKEQPSFSI